jgi:hypothetical protein
MGKNQNANVADKAPMSLMEQVLARTESNIVKKRGSSGKSTYLDRFVEVLTDSDGKPTEPKSRLQVIAEMSCAIAVEQIEADKAAGKRENDLELTESGDGPDDLLIAEINKKVKNQVASAIADNNNSTSISFNENYKDKWKVEKHSGNKISLIDLKASKEEVDETEE